MTFITRRQQGRDRSGTMPRQCVALMPVPGSIIPTQCELRAVKRGRCAGHAKMEKEARKARRELAARNLANPPLTLPRRTMDGLRPPLPVAERRELREKKWAAQRAACEPQRRSFQPEGR